MARRREREEEESSFSWYEQPLYDTGEEADPFDDDDIALPGKKARDKRRPEGTNEVGFVGGCFNVFLIALVSIILFIAVGVGVVLGGRAAGIFPQAGGSSAEAPDAVQTPSPAQQVIAVSGECQPQAWWDSQQAAFDYFSILYDRVTIAPFPAPIETLRSEMTSQQGTASTAAAPPCLAEARDAFVQAMSDSVSAVEAFNSSGRPAAAASAQRASAGLSNTLVALWDAGVATDPNTPPILNIPRGGDCDATQLANWAEPFRQQWLALNGVLSQSDIASGNAAVIQGTVTGLEAIRSNLSAIPAPPCVNRANQLSIIALNSYINAANLRLAENLDAARESASTYARSRVVLNAWLAWLGVEMV